MQLDQLAARPGSSLDCLDSHKKWTNFRGLVNSLPVAISTTNDHGNFGFTVRYKGNSPTGQSVYVFRGADGYDYVIKSNSWNGGSLAFSSNSGGAALVGFSAKANVTVIDPATGQPVAGKGGGNLTFRVDAIDNGNSGTQTTPDSYAISVYTPAGVLYHQAGTTGAQLPLHGGNVMIHT